MLGLRPRARKLHLGSESGQSLVLALIVMSALSISIAGVISFTTGNQGQFARDRQVQRAFAVAEAGLNDGIAVVSQADGSNTLGANTCLPASTPCGTTKYPVTLDGTSGTYYMQKYPAGNALCNRAGVPSTTPCWVVYGTATSPDGKTTRTLTENIFWKTQTTPETAIFNYGLFIDNKGSSCVDTHGTVNLTIKDVWISGDFCPKGNVGLAPPADNTGSVYIGGVFQGTNNTSIGASNLKYTTADIVGGCTKQGKAEICSDSANSNVWSYGTPTADPSTLQLPDINAATVYAEAPWNYWGSHCTTGSFTFDSDSTMNGTTPTTTLLPNTASFDCTVHATTSAASAAIGHLAWNNATQQLSISGQIWIDGNVNLAGSGTYVADTVVPTPAGSTPGGTIFINGTAGGAGNITICGPGNTTASGYGCPGTWNPNTATLGLVIVNPSNAATGFSRTGNGELDIEVLVNQGYADTGGTTVMGPVLADTATMGGNGGSVVPTAPPSGFPSTVTSSAAWVIQPGSWNQTQ